MADMQDLITVTVDGVEVKVPKGTNLIDVAHKVGVRVPHYCYYKHLSIAGNCRMCQVKVEGMPKLTIACNTKATDGMKVYTHRTSEEVAEAQRAVLEFLLINHPLDCTVCDQAGHCKLQDYYFQYNAQASRFIEEKEHKVKATVLGPEVIYDGERCILCSRCVRFCDEFAGTSELGIFNRGDRSVVGTHASKILDNPFSGTVCDLCPVGALTHRRWRFNTRIWFTSQQTSICTGCSTGCNVVAAVRDNRIVHVKGLTNSNVNCGWLCNEGRYGFERFQPAERLVSPLVKIGSEYQQKSLDRAFIDASNIASCGGDSAVLISPMLTTEEMWVALQFASKILGMSPSNPNVALQYRKRDLTDLESKLISPDYAPNAKAGVILGIVPNDENFRVSLEKKYLSLLERLRSGAIKRVLLVGDYSIANMELDESLVSAIRNCASSVQIGTRPVQPLNGEDILLGTRAVAKVVLPGQTVNEKSGSIINRTSRMQQLSVLLEAPVETLPDWVVLKRLAKACGKPILHESVNDEKALHQVMRENVEALKDMKLEVSRMQENL